MKVSIIVIPQNKVLPIITTHIKNALRHTLLPMIRIIKNAIDIFPVAKAMTVNG